MYKTLNGTGYQATTFLTAFGFPGLIFAGFFIINLFVWGYGSSAALPFSSMLAVCALWFGISVPLTFLGAFIGGFWVLDFCCFVVLFLFSLH